MGDIKERQRLKVWSVGGTMGRLHTHSLETYRPD